MNFFLKLQIRIKQPYPDNKSSLLSKKKKWLLSKDTFTDTLNQFWFSFETFMNQFGVEIWPNFGWKNILPSVYGLLMESKRWQFPPMCAEPNNIKIIILLLFYWYPAKILFSLGTLFIINYKKMTHEETNLFAHSH